MGILDILFGSKALLKEADVEQKAVEQSPPPSELTINVIRLLCYDFDNWKPAIGDTHVHLPTGIGLATTGESAFVYVGCNSINGRSGTMIEFDTHFEHARLYKILMEELKKNNQCKREIAYQNGLSQTNEYLKELNR